MSDVTLDQVEDLKKTKWELFQKKYAERIEKTVRPDHTGKKTVPAMWVDKIQDWVWVTREQRRRAGRKLK